MKGLPPRIFKETSMGIPSWTLQGLSYYMRAEGKRKKKGREKENWSHLSPSTGWQLRIVMRSLLVTMYTSSKQTHSQNGFPPGIPGGSSTAGYWNLVQQTDEHLHFLPAPFSWWPPHVVRHCSKDVNVTTFQDVQGEQVSLLARRCCWCFCRGATILSAAPPQPPAVLRVLPRSSLSDN